MLSVKIMRRLSVASDRFQAYAEWCLDEAKLESTARIGKAFSRCFQVCGWAFLMLIAAVVHDVIRQYALYRLCIKLRCFDRLGMLSDDQRSRVTEFL